MELTNFANFRNDFMSDVESIDTLDLQTTPLDLPMTLEFGSLKDFFSYLSAVHILEPVFSGELNLFIKPSEILGNYSMTYSAFEGTTVINDKPTILISSLGLHNATGLAFLDSGKFGERNTHKPLGTVGVGILDSKLSMSLLQVSEFYDKSFKNKFFKGNIVFSSIVFYTKGEVIYISDRDFYIIITTFKNNQNGSFGYSGLITIKGA